jgi:hypothetical protein
MAAPLGARIAGTELADPLRNYGHLVIRAARFACGHLDGRAVINRATGLPIGFAWERGLKQAVASGMAPELLLLIPALPMLLAGARYIGALADPKRRPHARQLLAFAVVAEVVGRPVDIRLIVREDRLGQCFFDRILLCGKSSLQRQEGRGARDSVQGANDDRSRAMRAVLTLPRRRLADGGDASAPDPVSGSPHGIGDEPNPWLAFAPDVPLPGLSPCATPPSPDEPSTLGYIGNTFLGGVLDAGRGQAIGEMDAAGQPDAAAALLAAPPGREVAQSWVYEHPVAPPNDFARYGATVAEAVAENPVLSAPEATIVGAIGPEGFSDVNKAAGSPVPDWLARLSGGIIGGSGGLVPRTRSWLGELLQQWLDTRPPASPPASLPDPAANQTAPELAPSTPRGETPQKAPDAEPSALQDDAARPTTGLGPSWKQIEYGGSDLTELAIAYRRLHNVSPGRGRRRYRVQRYGWIVKDDCGSKQSPSCRAHPSAPIARAKD